MNAETREQPESVSVPRSARGDLSSLEIGFLSFIAGTHVILATDAGVQRGWTLWIWFSFAAVCLWFMVRVAVLLRHLSNRQRVKLFRWVQVAGLAALFCLIHFTQLDLALRLWLSEDDVRDQVRFVQTVVRVHPNDYNGRLQKVPEYGWSALFRLRYYEATPDGKVVWFATVEGEPVYLGPDGFVSGIAFCELPEPPERSEMVYGHLYGPWWWWVEDF